MRSLALGIVLTVTSSAIAAPPLPPTAPPVPARDWPAMLGARSAAVEFTRRVVDRVVLVPDMATYLDEIGSWSPRGQWPVLFADEHLAPMFIRRFAPTEVVLREPISPVPAAPLRTRVERAIAHAWGARDTRMSLREAFAQSGHTPTGLVVTAEDDPAWTAAVALAAGRGQAIAWLAGDIGVPNRQLETAPADRLRSAIGQLAEATGYRWRDQGDDLDAVTVCRRMAGGIDAPLAPAIRAGMHGIDPSAVGPPFATTDWITRHDDGRRWAICGWIFGDETRAAYMAMCALFLPRDSILAIHTYEDGDPWDAYDPAPIADVLRARGFTVDVRADGDAGEQAWAELLTKGVDSDLIYMTSKGNADAFELSVGGGSSGDIPILRRPAVLCMVHSYSLRTPERPDTIGARWLAHGVYAYTGSMHEPFVAAFVPVEPMFARCLGAFPILAATRQYPTHTLAAPWKVQTIGDPLLTLPSPASRPDVARLRVTRTMGESLELVARESWRRASSSLTAADFRATAHLLAMLGRDDLLSQFWRLARQHGLEAAVAGSAVGTLYRAGRPEELRYAMSLIEDPDPIQLDMLWHLYGPLLPQRPDPAIVDLMLRCVRRPDVQHDLARLAPQYAAVHGLDRLRAVLTAERADTQRRAVRRGLDELIERYAR